jgi:hypothetical protein
MNKSSKLNKVLKERYQLDLLEGRVMPSHIQAVAEYYLEKKSFLQRTLTESQLNISPDYAKAYLISEAALMILREIAPKRMPKRKGK